MSTDLTVRRDAPRPPATTTHMNILTALSCSETLLPPAVEGSQVLTPFAMPLLMV